jgi:NAD(P)-dependent dehydrogenase (short-subunit alcohol dehydrogenase family)
LGSLDGKVAIVTGGARGIGAGIARCLARDGAHVAVLDLDGPEAETTAASLATTSIGLACDVAAEAAVERGIKEVAEKLGRLDILVNNAGAGRAPMDPAIFGAGSGRVEDLPGEAWDEQLSQNLRTTFLCTKFALPYIKAAGGGSIVNIASIAGISAQPTLPAYAAAKAGVISLRTRVTIE